MSSNADECPVVSSDDEKISQFRTILRYFGFQKCSHLLGNCPNPIVGYYGYEKSYL